jgi:hypothetical protein
VSGDLDLGRLGRGAAFHLGDLEELEVVADGLLEALERGELLFEVGPLAEQDLGLGLVVPEAGRAGAFVELIESALQGRDVKETPLAP